MRPDRQYYQRAAAMNDLVHRICPYTRGVSEECNNCPSVDTSEMETYGPLKKGCRALAEELIAVVLQWQDESATLPGSKGAVDG